MWGNDLGSDHERYLCEVAHGGAPVIVTHYPRECKAFYMREEDSGRVDLSRYRCQNGSSGEGSCVRVASGASGVTVAAMDLLMPRVGELIGGSQREERLARLEQAIARNTSVKRASSGDDNGSGPGGDYGWYCDLRKYGSIPHSGFGCGFERLVMLVTGVENIRDAIPFPRAPNMCDV